MDIITYALCKKYTDKIADSLGSLKGAPCTIKQTEELENGVQVTFEWIGSDGVKETTSIFVPAGPIGPTGLQGPQGDKGDAGVGIEKIEKTSTEGLIDTYQITFTDGAFFDFTVTNGKDAVVDLSNYYTKEETNQIIQDNFVPYTAEEVQNILDEVL